MSSFPAYGPMPRFYFEKRLEIMAQNGLHLVFPMGVPKNANPANLKLSSHMAVRLFFYAVSTGGTISFGGKSGDAVSSSEVFNGQSRIYNKPYGKHYDYSNRTGKVNAGDTFTLGIEAKYYNGTKVEGYFNFGWLADVILDYQAMYVWATWPRDHYALLSYHVYDLQTKPLKDLPLIEDWFPSLVQLNPGSYLHCTGEYSGKDTIRFKITKTTVDHLGKPSKSPSQVTLTIQRTLTNYVLLTDYGKVLSVLTTKIMEASIPDVPIFTSNFRMSHVVHVSPY